MKTLRNLLVICLTFGMMASANAALYVFETDPNAGGKGNDEIDRVYTSYNDNTEIFEFDVDFKTSNTFEADSWWLVVNNGPNPKGTDVNELVIIYGDMDTGIASAYLYNGKNSANSINQTGATFLETFSFTTGTESFELTLDATNINDSNLGSAGYKGIQFDNNLGIWFHFAKDSSVGYDTDNNITSYVHGDQGWYDAAGLETLEILQVDAPAPAIFALFIGALAFLGLRKR